MYLGRLCEVGDPVRIFDRPAHPYTAALLTAIPVADPTVVPAPVRLPGELPSPLAPPSGCRFRTRCPRADRTCAEIEPEMRPVGEDQYAACHHPLVEPSPVSAPHR
jgi:peptide/nickel transport system ATP-binding protein